MVLDATKLTIIELGLAPTEVSGLFLLRCPQKS
jgi:hypothetical protein